MKKRVDTKKVIGLVLFLCLIVLAIFLLPWNNTWQILRSADIRYVIIAFSLAIPLHIITSYTYKLILDGQNARISFWRLLLINIGMSFYDIVLPSTFVVSGLRWIRYSTHSQKPAQSFVSIAFYKVFNVLLALVLSLAFFSFTDVTSLQGHGWQFIILLGIILVIMLATPWSCRRLLKVLPESPVKLQSRKFFLRLWEYFYKIIQAFAEFEQLKLKTQIAVIVLGLINQLTMYVCYLFIVRSVGVNLTFAQLGALRAILILAMNLPFNFGVGINLREVTLLAILTAMGIALDKAVAISVISFGRVLFTGILGGFAELVNILFVNKHGTSVAIENRPVE
jgi:uncharacterized membrane protein YbhN (UPF0104 family)